MSKNFFLTLDLEEWYHLEYLVGKVPQRAAFVPHLEDFLGFLGEQDVSMTVFTLGEIAERHPQVVRMIAASGHEIACHGYDHELLYEKSDSAFRAQVTRAKAMLEDLAGRPVNGYRASCFSMNRSKLDVLRECGFTYDSSFIRFSGHALYRQFDLSDFSPADDLVYEKDGFFEFEVPTLALNNRSLPISGGGYFRLLPYALYLPIFKSYMKDHRNFVFYVHPFELTDAEVDLQGVPLKSRLRFSLGRRRNPRALRKFVSFLKRSGYEFRSMSEYTRSLAATH